MDENPFPILDKPEVLHEMTQAFHVPAARIEATAAWRSFQNSGDPREAAKLVTNLEYELRSLTTPPSKLGMDENPYKSPEVPGAQPGRRRWIGRISLILFLIAGLCLVVLLRLEYVGKPQSAQGAFRLWATSVAAWTFLVPSIMSGLLLLLLKLAGR